MTDCDITLLPQPQCSHCTKRPNMGWDKLEAKPRSVTSAYGYSAPIRYIGDSTVPSLEAFPPPLPAVEVSTKATSDEWDTAIVTTIRPEPRPKGYHWRVSGRPGGYIEGGWMDTEVPDVDLLDQPIEDTWI